MQTFTIETPAEFSFAECLYYLRRSANENLHIVEGNTYKKAVRIGKAAVYFTLTASPEDGKLLVNYMASGNNASTGGCLKSHIIEIFDLDRDLKPFYRMASQDPLLKQVVQNHFGLRLIIIPDLFESMCWAITGQQINLNFAYILKQRFVRQFGEAHEQQSDIIYLFPEPATIAALSVTDLKALQFSARKASYIIGIARAIRDGDLSKEKLQAMTFEQAEKELISIKGVGRWTANYVLLKCLKMPDAFPVEDVGLHHAIRRLMGLAQKPDLAMVVHLSQAWQGWRAYTAFYLWQTLLLHE